MLYLLRQTYYDNRSNDRHSIDTGLIIAIVFLYAAGGRCVGRI